MTINVHPTATERSFKARLVDELARLVHSATESELKAGPYDTPEIIATRMVGLRRLQNEWDHAIGPFFEVSGLMAWLGYSSRTNVLHAVQRRDILAVSVGRRNFYPTFQFSRGGDLLPRLRDVLDILDEQIESSWTQALWLKSPLGDVGRSPAELLRRGQVDVVLAAARDEVERRAR